MAGLMPKAKAPPPPPAIPAPVTMPTPDDDAIQAAKKKKMAETASRGGRDSTILSDSSDTLG